MQSSKLPSDIRLITFARFIASTNAILAGLLGALVLLGWALTIRWLTTPIPGQVSMKPLTAVAIVLAAAALWLLGEARPVGNRRRLALICAGVVAVLGDLILLEYLLKLDLGIDQVLFRQALLAENGVPIGRPAPATAFCLVMLGLALLLLDAKRRWGATLTALLVLLVAGLAVLGYAYSVTSLYQIGPYVPIAFHTALIFILLALGLLAARPDGPITSMVITSLAGGSLARRLLPAAIVIPFVLGLARLYGQSLGLYDTAFGVAILVTSNVVVFVGLTFACAHVLNGSDAKRQAIYDALRLTEENQRLMLDSIKDHAIFMVDTEGRVATWNAAAERIKGYTAAEIIGQPVSLFYLPEEAAAGRPQRLLEMAAANGSSEEEGLRVRKDGSRFWAIADTAALRDEHGVLRGYSKVTRDITERRQAETTLREREERLRVLADATPNGLIIVADSGEITWANQRAEALFGYRHEQLLGRSVDALVPRRFQAPHSPHRAAFADDRRARLMGASRELFGLRQDGSEFPVEIGLSPVETSQGQVTLASIIDITERKRDEAALRLSEERFAKAFRASPAALTVTRLSDGRFVEVNAQFLDLLGYQRDEVIGQTSAALNMFADPAGRAEPVQQLRTEGTVRNFEMDLLTKTGERRHVLFSTEEIELDGEASALTILIDNTERKEAQVALRLLNAELEARVAERTAELAASEAKFRTMFDVLPVGVSFLGDNREVVESNPALANIVRLTNERLATNPTAFRTFIHPDGSPMLPEEFPSARVQREQRPVFNVEMGIVTETGETIWVTSSGAPLPVAGFSAVLVTVDLTDRKRIEDNLRQSDERFAQAFRHSPIALTITRSADSAFVDVNEGFLSLFGYRRDEIIGHRATDLNVITDLDERAAMTRMFQAQGSVHNYETVRRTKSGELRHVLLSADPLQLNGDTHILTTMLDISDRKNAEAALRESQEKFSKAFYASGAGIVISRMADGLIVDANESYLRLVGYARDEIMGRTTLEIGAITPATREQFVAALWAQGQVRDMEIGVVTKSGEMRTVATSTERIMLGNEDCLLSILYDITDRKHIEQSLASERDQLQALLDNIPDTIYFKDRASRFTRINLAQARMLGIAAPEMAIGKTDADYQAPDLAAVFYAEEQRLLDSGQPVLDRLEFNPKPNGEPRWLSSTKVPLKDAEGHVSGLVGVSRDVTRRVKAEEALQQLNQRLAGRVNELSLLNRMEEKLQACTTVEETYPLTAQLMSQFAPGHSGALYFVTAQRTELATACTWGTPPLEPQTFGLDDCWAVRFGQLHLVDQARRGAPCGHWLEGASLGSLCMPLLAQGQVLGVLHLRAPATTGASTFDDELLQLVRVVTDSLALTWANLTLRETLRQQTIRDPLTGSYNRRFMEELLGRELHRAARTGQSVGMIMLDVDHFKHINDQYGHEAGDGVLRAIGQLLQDSSRGSDIPCRYGGEEFLLILPEATLDIARQRAEHIRAAFGLMEFGVGEAQLVRATLSLGVAAYPQHGDRLEAVVRAADAALYQAKHGGRDQTVVASV